MKNKIIEQANNSKSFEDMKEIETIVSNFLKVISFVNINSKP
jgi:hypothetical protein